MVGWFRSAGYADFVFTVAKAKIRVRVVLEGIDARIRRVELFFRV